VQGIEKLRTSEVVDNTSKNMSPAGQQVMQNLNQVLDTSKQVIQEKNSGQELQTIIQDGIHGGRGAAGKEGHSCLIAYYLRNVSNIYGRRHQQLVHRYW
jgi:Family of unknown function (DUF5923)